jgi:molybdopterin-containing oxidoreductase family iron-sulfur binding subunit
MTRRKAYELSEGKGPSMWRTLEDKNTSPEELKRLAEEESPGGFVTDLLSPKQLVSRRSFVQGSSIAALAAGLEGCVRRPESEILPYSKAPEHVIPGVPSHYATVTARGRDALGVVVTSHDGRPTKVEGNPIHRRSAGATDVRGQAYVWDLYDPDRSQSPAKRKGGGLVDVSDEDFDKLIAAVIAKHEKDEGASLRFLMRVTNSPTLRRMRDKTLAKFPKAKFYTYSPVNDDNVREGAKIAFGDTRYCAYNLQRAKTIVSIGADFLGAGPGAVANGRQFGLTRARVTNPDQVSTRLYVAETNFTVTGSMADNRLRLSPSQVERLPYLLAAALEKRGLSALSPMVKAVGPVDGAGIDAAFVDAVADELMSNQGSSVLIAGEALPGPVQALVVAMNAALGNIGKDKRLPIKVAVPIDPSDAPSGTSLSELASEIDSIETLVLLGGNPVYDAPADVDFAGLLGREGLTSIHVSSHRDETSALTTWHAPLAHELEAWGDQQSLDGMVTIQQPLIAPLYGGRNPIELLAVFAGEESTKANELVRTTHDTMLDGLAKVFGGLGAVPDSVSADGVWRGALHTGYLVASQQRDVPVNTEQVAASLGPLTKVKQPSPDGLEVRFEPDAALWDGQHANNLWALELPDPMTKVVWDNPALLSPATARALGVKSGQMLRLSKGDAAIEVPAWILPGHADNSVTLSLGWGRTAAGRYGNGKGFDVYPLRMTDGMSFATDVKVEPLRESYQIVQTQTHDRMEGRPIAIDATLDEYRKEPDFASYRSVDPVSTPPLWKQQDYSEGHQWGMVIDLNACTGCNACVVACQAENNIPVVGKFEVERGREMHWLRIDRYFVGDDENDPEVAVQPVTCQQCEEAPCENVCPVNATVHSPEGLNDMVYNRCVGTRYCANNCPYKVRRFNYLSWHGVLDDKYGWYKDFPESRKLQFNPNVTVRMRGVMEKCTYCVQRIEEGKIAAKREKRELRDGDVRSACQQVCPTLAISFGDLNDPRSRVSAAAKVNRNYKLLAEVGARPRTSFLARIRNPNPQLKGNG